MVLTFFPWATEPGRIPFRLPNIRWFYGSTAKVPLDADRSHGYPLSGGSSRKAEGVGVGADLPFDLPHLQPSLERGRASPLTQPVTPPPGPPPGRALRAGIELAFRTTSERPRATATKVGNPGGRPGRARTPARFRRSRGHGNPSRWRSGPCRGQGGRVLPDGVRGRKGDPEPLTAFSRAEVEDPTMGSRSLPRPSGCTAHPRECPFHPSKSSPPFVVR